MEVSTGEIHLPGDASSGTTFTVSAEEPWTLSYTGEGFAVTPDGGARGETTVTVTASEPNSAKARRKLGTITVRHPANKDGYPAEVYQRPAAANPAGGRHPIRGPTWCPPCTRQTVPD